MYGIVNTPNAANAIIASGITDGWRWDKYSDGTIRAKTVIKKMIACNTSIGSGSYLLRSDSIAFTIPSGLFKTITHPFLVATRQGDACTSFVKDQDSLTSIGGYVVIISTSGYTSANFTFAWEIVGTWK